MQTYNYQSIQQQQKQQYKQDLGLRKMLYKYQHQNQQLRNQIKALTQRLESILNDKSDTHANTHANASEGSNRVSLSHHKFLNQSLQIQYRRIQQLNGDIKQYKDVIDSNKQIQYSSLYNSYIDKCNKLNELRNKASKFKQQNELNANQSGANMNISPIVQNGGNVANQQMQQKYQKQVQDLKKQVRQLQKIRNAHHKQEISSHVYMIDLQTKTRNINSNNLNTNSINSSQQAMPMKVKKGVWNMEFSQDNYRKILEQFQQIKIDKNSRIQSIQVENNLLRDKLAKLKNQYIQMSVSPNAIDGTMNTSFRLKWIDSSTPKSLEKTKVKGKNMETIQLPQIPMQLGSSAYQRKNDKNYAVKKMKLIQWNPNKSSSNKKNPPGLSWNDENCKSPITGINIWLDKYLLGIQFIHTLSESSQHLHTESQKKLTPIQYRLNNNDYLQNIILILQPLSSSSAASISIVGLQLYSKTGRKDTFGAKSSTPGTEKFDFGIKSPEKPVYSFGSFVIDPAVRISRVWGLGFGVV